MNEDNFKLNFINIYKYNFHRCAGHQKCPFLEEGDYKCINNNDDMHKIHKQLVSGDAIYPVGYDLRFHERTRYLRRDNFRLTYHVVLLRDARYFPLFVKENSILCTKHQIKYAKLIKSGRKKVKVSDTTYEPVGHEQKL
jgi:hypothetical protein